MSTTCANRNARAGFTLIELMIVVAIIAILAAIALPIYQDYVTRSKITEATNNLSAYRVAMEQYYQDNRTYGGGGNCGASLTAVNNISHYFTLTCTPAGSATAASPQSYVATETGNAGSAVSGFTYTIDNANNKTSTVSTAWGGSKSCWITAKGTCQ